MPEQNIANSFEALFKNNYAKLCHFAMLFLKDDEVAKDVVQEVFVNYWKLKENALEEPTSEIGFLYSSVKNACLNKLRRRKLEENFLNKQEDNPKEEAVALNKMIRSELISELHKIIATLPKNCQLVFKMGYLEGLKNQHIATELGISINTVKTQKKRGLELLKIRLNPDLFTLILTFFLLKS